MTRNVVITGFGIFTAFGFGAEPLRTGVFGGNPAFAPVTRFDTACFRARHAATHRWASGDPDATPRQISVFLECARAALAMAGPPDPAAIPVLIGTQGDYTAVTDFWSTPEAARGTDPDAGAAGLAAWLPRRLGTELGLGEPRTAFINACVASTNAIIHGARLVAAGRADAVLCGGAYLVERELFAKFDSGAAFAVDGRIRPFSRDRSGLLLGDGVAALVIESEQSAVARGAEPLVRLAGWGMAADAYHVVRPDPAGSGMALAMNRALRRAGVRPERIGYVNAHGTGTAANDSAEATALSRVFGPGAGGVPVSSTKSTTGHLLEAAGAVEAVITMVALRTGLVPPTAGFTEPDPNCELDPVANQARHTSPRLAVSLNASFGGVNAALVMERL
ncbi:beta-ketoacyl-[acyl-carrier-protein] synthase family protein [Micromonospora sp. NBC_01740]|uniref:beta-ketoacyl-[acyl-carrier-protein] synthase family protein n=1 Tax=Micromonospora sp. NBC_01740 TaxID=2975986 RepID=UPI002E146AED|nr:beta-ketoacyl-[acyl-carrier-protein] synthase family protein [Micromonospora sp. NBC_01740]